MRDKIYTSKNQFGTFETKKVIGVPPQYDTITKAEANRLKKILTDYPGLKIFEYGKKGSGRYTIKLKVEKAGEIIQEDLAYSPDNLKTMLKKHKIVRNKLFPNQLSDIEFKRLRLLDQNIELTDKQFSEKLNKSRYLTNKGNKWTATSAFNVKRKLGLGSLGPRTFITDK